MITLVTAMLGAAGLVLGVLCIFMYKALCLADQNMGEYKELLQFIVDKHQFMPDSLLRKVQQLEDNVK